MEMALKKASINVRVNEDVKRNAEVTLKKLGLSMSDAVNLLLNQINLKKGIPFAVKIPNKETLQTFHDTDKGIGVTKYKSAEEMFRKLGLK